MNQSDIKRPSLKLYFTEPFRAIKDRQRGSKYLKRINAKPTKNGQPVLVIPGFMASGASTKSIRYLVENLGYEPYDWACGRNYGEVEKVQQVSNLIDQIYAKKQQKITLIGWSLGGVFARVLAKEHPTKIDQVITLASPFASLTAPNNASWLFSLITGGKKVKDAAQQWLDDLAEPPTIPTTAVYTKQDGIVPWAACMNPITNKEHRNIEVNGAHIGLGYNPEVFQIIEKALSQQKEKQ